MEIQNTLENKAKFFALYWGQKVLNRGTILEYIKHIYIDIFKHHLELYPLSSITDEELKLIGGFTGNRIQRAEFKYLIFSQSIFTAEFAISFLRSKGYALPFMGLSVEKQIEYGWIKLTENEKHTNT